MPSTTVSSPHARDLSRTAIDRITTVPRTVLAALCALLVTSVLWAGSAQPAAAHDELVSTDPSAGATVDAAPESITLTFSGNVMDIGREIRVTDSGGESLVQRESTVDRQRVIQPLGDAGSTEDETYTVVWRVVSEDGHPIEGRFDYSVGQGAQSQPSGEATPEQNTATSEPQNEGTEQSESASDAQDSGMPGWLIPVIGGVAALAALIAILVVVTRPKQR